MITEFVVTAGEQPKRLDVFLVNRERDMSRSRLQRLIELGRIRINDQVVRPSQKIKPGDKITMDVPKPEPLELQGEDSHVSQKPRDMGHPAFARAPNQLQRVASADHAPPPQALLVDKRSAAGIDLELEDKGSVRGKR